jgi:hypothetical protein
MAHVTVQQPRVDIVRLRADAGVFQDVIDFHVFRPLVSLSTKSRVLHRLNGAGCSSSAFERTRLVVTARFVDPSSEEPFIDVDASSHTNVTVSNLNAVSIVDGWVQALRAPSSATISLPYTEPVSAHLQSAAVQVLDQELCVDDLKPIAMSHATASVEAVADGVEVTVMVSQQFKDPDDVAMVVVYAQLTPNVSNLPVWMDVTDQVRF